jgi:hypothetical protein
MTNTKDESRTAFPERIVNPGRALARCNARFDSFGGDGKWLR